jgi:hypothetical protein
MAKRANIYVDGFNLYYGALKGTSYKWLDLEALSRRLVPHYDINRIRYFTARIIQDPAEPAPWRRQHFYLRALATNPLICIHKGRFQRTVTRTVLATPQPGRSRTVEVVKTEEKGTDVNIASYLLLDAFREDSDLAVVISNDADLAEPMRIALGELDIDVGIANPFKCLSSELSREACLRRHNCRRCLRMKWDLSGALRRGNETVVKIKRPRPKGRGRKPPSYSGTVRFVLRN